MLRLMFGRLRKNNETYVEYMQNRTHEIEEFMGALSYDNWIEAARRKKWRGIKQNAKRVKTEKNKFSGFLTTIAFSWNIISDLPSSLVLYPRMTA